MDCFHNGHIIPYEKAVVHVSDLAVLRAYAVFDYLRTYNGRPFRLPDHIERFQNSARELELELRFSGDDIAGAIDDLLRRSTLLEAAVRLVLTGGRSADSLSPGDPNFFVLVEKLPEYHRSCWDDGVTLVTEDFHRDYPIVKSTGYLNAIRRLPAARIAGAHDILYCHEGRVLELTRNNFFLFHGDVLATPKDDILLGITRKVVLDLCRGVFDVEERDVKTGELARATEAFLCGTTKGVMPVIGVGDAPIGGGTVGRNTRRVMALFREYTQETTD